jgi:hypothetical protein
MRGSGYRNLVLVFCNRYDCGSSVRTLTALFPLSDRDIRVMGSNYLSSGSSFSVFLVTKISLRHIANCCFVCPSSDFILKMPMANWNHFCL